jgi:hypothetical protein
MHGIVIVTLMYAAIFGVVVLWIWLAIGGD